MALARTVLPVPGTSSISRWPRHSRAHQGEADLVVLADDDAFDVGEDLVPGFLDLGHRPLSRALARRVRRGRGGVAVGDGWTVWSRGR